MKKFAVALAILSAIGCSPSREAVSVIKGETGAPGQDGANGHSLVSQFASLSEESLECRNGGASLNLYIDMDDSLSSTVGDLFTGSLVACNGVNGLDGLNGLDGEVGSRGAPGLDGKDGRPGKDGANGTNGEDGHDGENGKDGAKGVAGAAGPQGPAGPQGSPGALGPAGPIGQTGSQGAQGAQGPIGPVGPQGPVGPVGAVGSGATITAYSSSSCTLIVGSSPSFYAKSGSLYSKSGCSSNDKVNTSSGDSVWVASKVLAVYDGSSSIRIINFN